MHRLLTWLAHHATGHFAGPRVVCGGCNQPNCRVGEHDGLKVRVQPVRAAIAAQRTEET
jgi:hypothetical protein